MSRGENFCTYKLCNNKLLSVHTIHKTDSLHFDQAMCILTFLSSLNRKINITVPKPTSTMRGSEMEKNRTSMFLGKQVVTGNRAVK